MKFCERPFMFAYLAPDGEVWPCSWMHYPIGNLYEQSFEEIWHSDKAQKARASILDGSFAYCRKTSCPLCERDSLPDLTREEIEEKISSYTAPEYFSISNDHTCNLACTTCRKASFRPTPEYRAKIDRALNDILPWVAQAKNIDLNGNGEFLASPSFMEMIENLRPVLNDQHILLQTNGILFDWEHWSRFSHLSSHHLSVCVTINSIHRNTYRYLSGGYDKLDTVLDNLCFLSGLRREEKIKELTVTMVVQECNFQEIPEYIDFLTRSENFAVDSLVLKPVYKWFGMDEETYWFKNVLNPLHPYHKEYLQILENDCWKNPKVYDWGCHNLREARLHPLSQEKIYNRLLLDIYENSQGLPPVEYVKNCADEKKLRHIGVWGENETVQAILRLLQKAGVKIAFQLTWFQDEDGDIPKVSMQKFRPELANTILLLDFYDRQNLTNNLRTLKFQGQILTAEELIEGTPS